MAEATSTILTGTLTKQGKCNDLHFIIISINQQIIIILLHTMMHGIYQAVVTFTGSILSQLLLLNHEIMLLLILSSISTTDY